MEVMGFCVGIVVVGLVILFAFPRMGEARVDFKTAFSDERDEAMTDFLSQAWPHLQSGEVVTGSRRPDGSIGLDYVGDKKVS